jgi:hypothetical protein
MQLLVTFKKKITFLFFHFSTYDAILFDRCLLFTLIRHSLFTDIIGSNNITDNVAVISGYWMVKNKYTHHKYDQWFNNSLRINQTTYFFCEDQESINYIKSFRGDLPTIYSNYSIENFNANKFFKPNWVHPNYVPSEELGKIWHEKIHLMKKVKNMDNEKRQFYVWVDAGICVFRDKAPPNSRLNLKDINSLPHDKLCYSDPGDGNEIHNFSGGVLIMHRDMVDKIYDLYMEHLSKCDEKFNDWRCGIDQVIFTEMMKDRPDMFLKIASGYGMSLVKLYDHQV